MVFFHNGLRELSHLSLFDEVAQNLEGGLHVCGAECSVLLTKLLLNSPLAAVEAEVCERYVALDEIKPSLTLVTLLAHSRSSLRNK